jgi:DNA polymerase III epsilon subunit-like protein
MTKILVFDTETTGLPEKTYNSFEKQKEHERKMLSISELKKKNNVWASEIEKYPSIIQLAYILYDTDNPSESKIYNKYINIPESINISEESEKIHGISKEKIKSIDSFSKAYIYDSLKEFMMDFAEADVIVGHNVDFDRRMIVAEFLRLSKDLNMPHIKEIMKDENFECTQEITTPVCNLKSNFEYTDPKTGIPKYIYRIKSPKLIEAYEHYFGYKPDGTQMHDAIIDVVVCLRVYGMSFPGGQAFDVCNTNDKIKELILKVSPYNQDTCEVTNQFLVSNDNQGFLQPGMVPISNALSNSRSYSKSRAKSNSNSNSIVNSISFNPGSQEL